MVTVGKVRRPREVPRELFGIGERLERAMRDRQFDQVRLEVASGVDQGAISRLLNEKSLTALWVGTVIKLAKALRVSPGYLLVGEGDVLPEWRPARESVDETPIPRSSVIPSSR